MCAFNTILQKAYSECEIVNAIGKYFLMQQRRTRHILSNLN